MARARRQEAGGGMTPSALSSSAAYAAAPWSIAGGFAVGGLAAHGRAPAGGSAAHRAEGDQPMTRKRRRLLLVLACGVGLGAADRAGAVGVQRQSGLLLPPTELAAKAPRDRPHVPPRRPGRGGSVRHARDGRQAGGDFHVTDGKRHGAGDLCGVLPDLFREGQGVVAMGALAAGRHASAPPEVLAKHDENYMPKEVVDALKKSGHWNPSRGRRRRRPRPGTRCRCKPAVAGARRGRG